jgi:mitochondrial fission protein ELM1
MAVRTLRVISAFLSGRDLRSCGTVRNAPVRIVLEPKDGPTAAAKPPVRIFIGTEAAQFRAERTLLWSIKRQRDLTRRYEIYLMKDIAGFHRLRWLTGFTNYRYAIPEFAGFQGRAIYNDADQIYLDDPAKLFDADMQGHGVLSIHDHDTSVMLIDCARTASIWNLQSAQTTRRRELEVRMRAVDGLWGLLDNAWNTHGEEYVPGKSRLVHYTTIHSQPWRPTPRDFVYQDNPAAELWLSLEREADAARFQLFDVKHPSPDFSAVHNEAGSLPQGWRQAEYRRLAEEAATSSVRYLRPNAEQSSGAIAWPMRMPVSGSASGNDVCVADGLESLPDWDLPWWLDSLFGQARRAVQVTVDLTDTGSLHAPVNPLWWYGQMVAAGARTPGIHWRLALRERGRMGVTGIRRWSGGPPLGHPPRVWLLQYHKTGHRSQALGLAEALGWSYETREVAATPLRYLLAALGSLFRRGRGRLPGNIEAPWPAVVISSGWLTAVIARWIARQNFGNTRLILLGRKAGAVGETQNITVGCRHFRLPPEPRRIETVLPPNKVNMDALAGAAQRWARLYQDRPRPRVALLAGGSSSQYLLDARTARSMVTAVRRRVEETGGSLAVVTSRRTGKEVTAAMREAAGPDALFEVWSPHREDDNPYLGYLAGADALVVTGESESMLAEAVTTNKPVYIYPLPHRRPGLLQRLAEAVYRRAQNDHLNDRGSRSPQQGLQYLCARALYLRLLVPPRRLETLHRGLVDMDVARMFGEPFGDWQPQPWHETEDVAAQIRELLGPTTPPSDRGAPRVATAP